LAVILPIIASVLAWFWTGVSTSARDCATGNGSSYVELVGFVVLALAAPSAIGWHSRRSGERARRAVVLVVISVMLGAVLVVLASQVWWSGHNCYT
jgi:hypothetical protein